MITTVIDGVTFYCHSFVEWKERHSWWKGFIIGLIVSVPMHAFFNWAWRGW